MIAYARIFEWFIRAHCDGRGDGMEDFHNYGAGVLHATDAQYELGDGYSLTDMMDGKKAFTFTSHLFGPTE